MKLSTYLSRNDLSREQFAAKAGVARTTVMRLLDHGMVPRRATAEKIVTATDGQVSEADLHLEAISARAALSNRAA